MHPELSRVLLTGASRGLGAALARALAARGYRLFLAARNAEELRTRATALEREHGAPVGCMRVDLRDAADCRALAAAAESHLGGIDVLINNAAIGQYKPVVEWSDVEVLDVLALNLAAPILLARAALPGMLARGRGYIVDVASDLARRPLANMAPYVASKFGLLGFGASLHREVRDRGVRLTTVMPGIIDSAFNEGKEGSKDERWALPTDVVAARIVELLELPYNVMVDELTIHPASGDY
ncbi:MAG TPA: SDR family NAD(P)-dependent oxidoreductase [Burkholderiaceae bacterium]|nr:SDR family NAD(P)-dependent oxidoreductase [Burkholderiaceae bacterium]